ncbi:MAG TPA: isocitrate lyase/phosphoenolpyruvate mutase family protein [Solirubrobacteraceae bacterium]|nr:isocitrate lyase/phosphoenolpyruvate mutase family protein [Solirubrobacteraceae bacterium]
MPDLAARAARLRALHTPGDPLLLLNAWDAASARAVATAGLPAVATTSSGTARALGYADRERTPAGAMLAAVARIAAAVDVPVTADLEAGYGLVPGELAERLLEAGAAGLNLEDSDHAGGGGALRDPGAQAAYLAAVKDAARGAGVDVVLNARVDVHLRAHGPAEDRLEAALARAHRYAEAGADCVYPIGLGDEGALAAFVARCPVAVNALWTRASPPPARLAELGVARVSVGGGLFAATLQSAEALIARLRAGDPTALADD